MVVKIEQIRESGLRVDEPVDLALLGEVLGGTGLRAVREGTLGVDLRRVSGGVLLQGRLGLELQGPCKRCLVETSTRISHDFTLNLVPRALLRQEEGDGDEDEGADRGQGESAGSFGLDDVDREAFDGKTIEMDPIVREQVLLALPMNVVCREDCRGLCSTCGQNLNERDCGHAQRVLDPRLAALRDIKLS